MAGALRCAAPSRGSAKPIAVGLAMLAPRSGVQPSRRLASPAHEISRRLVSPAHEIWIAECLGGGHRCSGALLHLLGGHVLDVSGDVPAVTEGVLEPPRAIAVELVLDRT